MLGWSLAYIALALFNIFTAYISYGIAVKLHKDRNPGAIGAFISFVANIFCCIAVMSIYFHAMFFGT